MNTGRNKEPDAYAILGIGQEAGDEQIRAAYLAKLKQFPPDRSPQEFEQVRDAYEVLRDRRRRARTMLFAADPDAPFQSLLPATEVQRRVTGPDPWLAVLKGR